MNKRIIDNWCYSENIFGVGVDGSLSFQNVLCVGMFIENIEENVKEVVKKRKPQKKEKI
jgi:hypothetical protein